MAAQNEVNILRGTDFIVRVKQIMWANAATKLLAADATVPPAADPEKTVLDHNFIVTFVASPQGVAAKVAEAVLALLAPDADDTAYTDAQVAAEIATALPLLSAAKRTAGGALDIPAATV